MVDNDYTLEGRFEIANENMKQEMNELIIQILYKTGIRKTTTVMINGREFDAVEQTYPDENGIIYFDYSVFEKRIRRGNYYNCHTCELVTEDRGENEFGLVMNMIMIILESYSDSPCYLMHSGSYPYEIMCVKKELQKFSETYGFDRKKRLYELLKLPYDERQGIACQKYGGLAEMTLRIPARVFVYLFAEIQGFDFWTEWHEVHGEFYVDEITKNYVGESVVKKREEIRNTQIGKLKTKDFLKNNGCFTFYNTPAELKDKPDYYLSDDDLMYWWDGTDTVQLSIRMIETLNRWSVELKKFETEINRDEIEDYDMLKSLLELLDRANHEYRDIYAFQNMFYEFAQNNKDIHYFAAIKLFEKILDENWETGKIIQSVESWSTASKNVICNEGRINVKRYLSVLANKKLRVKCFGF